MEPNSKFLSTYSLPAPQTSLPLIPFTAEEIIGCTNEAATGANKAPRNPSSCFFVSCFTVSVIPSFNTFKFFNDFFILITSFISSVEIQKKVSPFSTLTAPFSAIFLSNSFIAFEAKLLTYPVKLSLSKGMATFVSAFFLPKLAHLI